MKTIQGLSFLALVRETAAGWPGPPSFLQNPFYRVVFFCLTFGSSTALAQTNEETNSALEAKFSISAERLDQIRDPARDRDFFRAKVREQLIDNFDLRTMQYYALRENLRGRDEERMREDYGRTMQRRIERSFTRSALRVLEQTPIGVYVRDGELKEKIFNIFKDSVTEETPTIGTPALEEEDPHIDYDLEPPLAEKPAWRDAFDFFIRPWSMHPNMGVSFKVDGVRAQIKAYHDEVKFSVYTPLTDTWSLYTSARLKEFDPEEYGFSFGFQNTIYCIPGAMPAVLQYGVAVRNHEIHRGTTSFREMRPHAFVSLVFDY